MDKNSTDKIAFVMQSAVLGILLWKMIQKSCKDKGIDIAEIIEDEKVRDEIFDIITTNCSSLGINKMAIVNELTSKVRNERMKRKESEKQIKYFEDRIAFFERNIKAVERRRLRRLEVKENKLKQK